MEWESAILILVALCMMGCSLIINEMEKELKLEKMVINTLGIE